MKWIRRGFLVLVVLCLALVAALIGTALRTEKPVGFHYVQALDASGRAFPVGVWYPTEARPWPTTWMGIRMMSVASNAAVAGRALPLVVISHGNSGSPGSHADLALALANAGYVVAAPMHTGDNYMDQGVAGTVPWLSSRSQELQATVDHMLKGWSGHAQVDPGRVGAFGFSAGGITVLTAAGAQPDLRQIATHCARTPEFICVLLRDGGSPLLNPALAEKGNAFSPERRIKAAAVASPGLGFLLGPEALAKVNLPVQLWNGENDTHVPYATNTRVVRAALGPHVEYHSIPGAEHFSFLVPCGLVGPPLLCADKGSFDRAAFHASMNASVVAFFDKHLNSPRSAQR